MMVLRGATLIDGTGAAPVRDAAIIVNDGRVETVPSAAAGLATP